VVAKVRRLCDITKINTKNLVVLSVCTTFATDFKQQTETNGK